MIVQETVKLLFSPRKMIKFADNRVNYRINFYRGGFVL